MANFQTADVGGGGGGCPFHKALPPGGKSVAKQGKIGSSSTLSSHALFSKNAKIEDLVHHLVEERLRIQVDTKEVIQKLHGEYIFTVGHLSILTTQELRDVQLPITLYVLLKTYCKEVALPSTSSSTTLHKSLGGSHSGGEDTSEQENDKNFLGITDKQRQLLIECWQAVVSRDFNAESGESTASKFFTSVWNKWTILDDVAQSMFKARNFQDRVRHLTKIMSFVIKCLDDPLVGLARVPSLGVQHCIWQIDTQSFASLAIAVVEGMEKALGASRITHDIKDAWFSTITNIGAEIVKQYEPVKQGWVESLYRRQGGTWKKVWVKVTDEHLYVYRTSAMKLSEVKLMWKLISDIGRVDDESVANKPTEFVFYLQVGSMKKYFAAPTEKNLHKWMEQGRARINAYSRLSGPPPSDAAALKTARVDRNLFSIAKKIQIHGDKTGKKSVEVRRHLDAQIKQDIDFRLFDSLLHTTIVINEQGIVQYVNPATIDLTGYTPSQLIGNNIKMIMPKNVAQEHDSYISNFIQTRQSKIIGRGRYVMLKHAEGHEKQCHLTVTEHTGTVRRLFIGTLAEANEGDDDSASDGEMTTRFSVFDNLLQSTIVIKSDSKIVYVNPATEKFTGYKPEELLGYNVNILMPEEIAQKHDMYVSNYVKTKEAKIIGKGRNVPIKHKSGEIIHGHLEVTEHPNPSGGSPMFVGSLTFTQESQELSLRNTLEKHSVVLKGLTVPVIVITPDGTVRLYNKPAVRAFGWPASKVIGKNVNILMTKEHARDHNSYIQNYMTTRKARIIGKGRVVKVKCADGSTKDCHLTVTCKGKQHTIFIGVLAVLEEDHSDIVG